MQEGDLSGTPASLEGKFWKFILKPKVAFGFSLFFALHVIVSPGGKSVLSLFLALLGTFYLGIRYGAKMQAEMETSESQSDKSGQE